MSWDDERVELLKKMWAEGKSASEIAKTLGGITRNAVIGKVHRLGLGSRADDTASGPKEKTDSKNAKEKVSANKKPAKATPPPSPAAPAASPVKKLVITAGQRLPPQPSANEVSAEALANVRKVEKKAKKISLMELTERTCKWPIGDPATEKFWFCGHAVQPGKPYCEAHVAVAVQPMSTRRDRRR